MIRFTKDSSKPAWYGYVYAALFFLVAMIETLLRHQYFQRCFTLGMRIRTAIIAAVYNKVRLPCQQTSAQCCTCFSHLAHSQSLRLSNKARRTSTVGEIVNLMSVDAQYFVRLMPRLNGIWSIPLQIILTLIFLYFTMGVSIFAGFAVMVLMSLVNVSITSYTKKLQSKKMSFKDSRIKLLNDILYGIKVIPCQHHSSLIMHCIHPCR